VLVVKVKKSQEILETVLEGQLVLLSAHFRPLPAGGKFPQVKEWVIPLYFTVRNMCYRMG
jgi:hypothetical protein